MSSATMPEDRIRPSDAVWVADIEEQIRSLRALSRAYQESANTLAQLVSSTLTTQYGLAEGDRIIHGSIVRAQKASADG